MKENIPGCSKKMNPLHYRYNFKSCVDPGFCFPGKSYPASRDYAARSSVQKRIKIVEVYLATKSDCPNSTTISDRLSRKELSNRRFTIKRLLGKFRETGSTQDNTKARNGWQRTVKTENHIVTVRQLFKFE